MCKSTIYQLLLTIMLLLFPITGMAQQNTNINKPTRARVAGNQNQDKKNDQQQTAKGKKDVKNDAKQDNNKNVKAVDKKDAKEPAPKDVKPADKNDDKTASKQDNTKANNDTAAKTATTSKPKKVPLDPEKVQFDGIDISRHQGNINWEELKKNTKIKFVYIKATEGSNLVDPRYKENIRNARKHGFKVGSYHFFTDLSGAKQQFINFAQTANRDEQDLVPVIDVERLGKWTPQQLRDSVKVFADLIEEYYGCKPMIYTFETFFNRNLGRSFDKYPIFIAKYPKGQEKPNINGVKWVLWQFSECGRFKGIKDNLVDMSRFNKGYTLEDIIYKPGKTKPRMSVKDAVDHKEKPASVNMTEQKSKTAAPAPSKKQQEQAKQKAERDKRAQEAKKKKDAEDAAKKKAEAEKEAKKKADAQKRAKEKAEADKKAKEKAEAEKKARQAARDKAAKEAADAKAKRKADAQKARQEKTQSQKSGKSNTKSANLLQPTNPKLTQSQHNDSIRTVNNQGRKHNKSSADND